MYAPFQKEPTYNCKTMPNKMLFKLNVSNELSKTENTNGFEKLADTSDLSTDVFSIFEEE